MLLHAYDAVGRRLCQPLQRHVGVRDLRQRPRHACSRRATDSASSRCTAGATARRSILASEIKAIVASGWYTPDINWATAGRFLAAAISTTRTDTFYAGIEQLACGIDARDRSDGQMQRAPVLVDRRAAARPPPEDPVAAFRELFEDAVRLRMRSDVPVGVCLSGGIDSNAIISMMARPAPRHGRYPLQAFSYIPEEFSEAEYINESIARTGAELNELHTDAAASSGTSCRTRCGTTTSPVHSPTALIGYQLMRLAQTAAASPSC